MSKVGFRVCERFSNRDGDSWTTYVTWSGLKQLTEVVGLDASLCPSTLGVLTEPDWAHLLFGEELGDCFDDRDYLATRATGTFDEHRHQFLAVMREASAQEVEAVRLPGFRFMGFELIDESTTSALTNCGGFPEAFDKSELTQCGLIESPSRAYAIRDALVTRFPDEPHADCIVWAIWRHDTA